MLAHLKSPTKTSCKNIDSSLYIFQYILILWVQMSIVKCQDFGLKPNGEESCKVLHLASESGIAQRFT